VLDLLGITAETPLKVELARDGCRALVITPLVPQLGNGVSSDDEACWFV
jgi:hypothetical protein